MMATAVKLNLIGVDEVKQLLERYGGPAAKKALRKAFRAALSPIVKQARKYAPVLRKPKKGRVKGHLRRSIVVRAGKRSRRYIAMVTMVGVGGGRHWTGKATGGETFYGPMQEWGWHAGRRTSYSRSYRGAARLARKTGMAYMDRPFIPGKHFMERAAVTKERAALAALQQTLVTELDKLDRA